MQTAETRSKLIIVTEDFLAAGKYSPCAQSAFSSLFHRHYRSASLDDRTTVANMLSSSRGIPLDVLNLLCCDHDSVASPILSHSPNLSGSDLTTLILQGTRVERQAIARRTDLNSLLVSNLLSFGEPTVAQTLLGNEAILTGLPEKLRKRMKNVGGAADEQGGRRGMTANKDKLDRLVDAMEQDWQAHYRPDTLSGAPIINKPDPADQSEAPMPSKSQMPSKTDEETANTPGLASNDPVPDTEPSATVGTNRDDSLLDAADLGAAGRAGRERLGVARR